MATLPVYRQQVSPSGFGVTPRASGQDAVGNALQNVGEAGMQVSANLTRQQKIKEDEDARAWTSSALSNSHVEWSKRMAQMEEQAEPGAPKFTENLQSEFDKYRTEAIANAPNEAAKKFYGERLDAMRASLVGQGVSFEARQRASWKLQQANEAGENVASIAAIDPEQAKTMLGEQLAILNGYENKALAQHLARGMTVKASTSAVAGMVERNPAETLELLNQRMSKDGEKKTGNLWIDNLDGNQLLALRNRAETELNRIAAEDRYGIVNRTKDVQSMVMAGVSPPEGTAPTVEQYTRAFGPSGAERWQQEVGNFLQIGGAIQSMRTSSAAEREQILAAQAPTAGAGFAGNAQMYEAVKQAKALVEKQIAADPAAYVMATFPRAAEYARGVALVSGLPNATPAQRAEAVNSFAQVMESEQLRLGVGTIRDDATGNKPRGPKLLTNAQANAIADMFADQQTGGANSATLVTQLEQQWGKYWPKVYGQLAQDNKLPAAALVIPNMPNDASRSRMASVSVMKDDDLNKLLGSGDPKDIRDAILSNFDEAQRTFTAQGASGNSTLTTVMEQAEKLAKFYRTQGKSVKESARQAYTETMGHRYQWGDTYRVPNQYDMKQVRSGAEAAVETLVKTGGATVFAGAAPQALTDDVLRARSMWITNSDETGLELRLRGADGGVYAVLNKDGLPVAVNWADLTTRAKTAKVQDDTREGNEAWFRRRQEELNPRR